MNITKEWLRENVACAAGYKWFCNQNETDLAKVCCKLVDENHKSWAAWVLTHVMTQKQNVQFAVFCAESVLHLFEDKVPADDRPRKAIEAAKLWLKNPENNTAAAADAARAAAAAADAARATGYAAAAAADAARAAGYAAAAAADAITAAYYASSAAYALTLLEE